VPLPSFAQTESWRPASFQEALLAAVLFGLLGLLLVFIGYKIFDKITPRIDVEKELSEKHNVAVAIVIAALILGVSYIVAHAIGG